VLRNHLVIGFNWRNFDVPICWMAVLGYPIRTLKKVANDIILRDKKPWDMERDSSFRSRRT
jgi:hypothetical protein